jgi:uncharacterized protein YjcR
MVLNDGQQPRVEAPMHTHKAETPDKELQARELWRQAMRPVEIAAETGMSVSQGYRLCKDLEREGEWKPRNRWDAK